MGKSYDIGKWVVPPPEGYYREIDTVGFDTLEPLLSQATSPHIGYYFPAIIKCYYLSGKKDVDTLRAELEGYLNGPESAELLRKNTERFIEILDSLLAAQTEA